MEKRKHRFNIVDVIVILLVAAAAVLLIVHFTKGGEKKKTSVTFVMQTVQTDVSTMIPDELSDNVAAGDAVYDVGSGRKIGEVVACDARGALYTSGATGAVSEVAGYKTLYITCEAVCVEEGGSLVSNGVVLSVGNRYSLSTPRLACIADCIAIDAASAGD